LKKQGWERGKEGPLFSSDVDLFLNQLQVCRNRVRELIDRGSLVQPSELHYLERALKETKEIGQTLKQ
jgi:hypothetical protein